MRFSPLPKNIKKSEREVEWDKVPEKFMNKKMVILIAAIAIIVIGIIIGVVVTRDSNPDVPTVPSTPTEPTQNGEQMGTNPSGNGGNTDTDAKSWANRAWLGSVDPESVTSIHFVKTANGASSSQSWKFDGLDCYMVDGAVYVVTGEAHEIDGSMSGAFADMVNLETIDGLEHLDTSAVTDMSYMFNNCTKLSTLCVSNLNTESVVNAEAMFKWCESLKEIDMSEMDMRNAVDMDEIFAYCRGAYEIGLPKTRDVLYLSRAFECVGRYANNRATINGVWDTSKCQDMSYMFTLASLCNYDYSFVQDWNTSSLVNAEGMFYQCNLDCSLDLTRWETKNIKNAAMMFGMSALKGCNMTGWDMRSLECCDKMFMNCSGLTTLELGWVNVNDIDSAVRMFDCCISLTTLDISCFNGITFGDATEMLSYNDSLVTIYCNGFSATRSTEMFVGCYQLVGAVPYSSSNVDVNMANLNGYFSEKN